ncbi:hypothetical protein F5X68DRAFT_145220 [Plectosphaerella plurivora]|uniref:AB hydrolase-1 domain-containing protein n=1 Tax=Plectosphaerella plurivora TaxID=936078 RepID=A0A9P8V0R8_9PEZI|nr:hypothetical protein F5X68DRAFT_145220 [Plectosphaerella plurivora]
MLLGQTRPEWALVKIGAAIFAFPAVAAVIYFVLAAAIFGVRGISHPFSIIVEVFGLLEVLWYFAFYIPYREYLQRPGYRPPPLAQEARRALILECLDTIPDYDTFQKKWALGAQSEDIKRENVKDWLLWALFDRKGPPGADDAELEEYVDVFESKLGKEIKSGRGDAEMMRLDFDRVRMLHRSLLWYIIVGGADMLTIIGMAVLGFGFRRQARSTFFTTFPPRPLTLVAPASPAPELSYFYRPHKSTTHRPIVLIHGIGIGYMPYLPLLRLLPRDVGIIAIEILPVSCRITAPLPPTDAVAQAIATIVAHHQAEGFPEEVVLTVHSFGSLYAAALLRRMSSSIHSLVLMDPVSLLLHLPDVAYNFTRRTPKYANELQIWLAVASDSNVAHTLARRICWREMRLTREDLLTEGMPAADGTHRALRRTTALFGGRDNVTNPDAVASYVYSGRARHAEVDRKDWRMSPARWTGQGELELMYLDGLDHGQAFLSRRHLPLLAKVLNTYAALEAEPKMETE